MFLLRNQTSWEDIDYKAYRGLDRSVMLRLIGCEWIQNHQNIIVTGPTGVGKTYFACALANKACREGYRSFYLRTPGSLTSWLAMEAGVADHEWNLGEIIQLLEIKRKNLIIFLIDICEGSRRGGFSPHLFDACSYFS